MSLRVAVLNREARSTRVASARHPCIGHHAQATVHRPPCTDHRAQAGLHRSLPPRPPRAPRPPPRRRCAWSSARAWRASASALRPSAPASSSLRSRCVEPRWGHGGATVGPWWVTMGSWWGHGGSRWGHGGVTVGSTAWSPHAHAHAHVHMPCAHLRPPPEQADGAGVAAGLHVGDRVVAVQGKVRRGGAPSALWLPCGCGRPAPSYLPTDY